MLKAFKYISEVNIGFCLLSLIVFSDFEQGTIITGNCIDISGELFVIVEFALRRIHGLCSLFEAKPCRPGIS